MNSLFEGALQRFHNGIALTLVVSVDLLLRCSFFKGLESGIVASKKAASSLKLLVLLSRFAFFSGGAALVVVFSAAVLAATLAPLSLPLPPLNLQPPLLPPTL